MKKISIKRIVLIIAIILSPTLIWATRGPEDYGIIMVVMFMIYTFPVGILLLCFILYSFLKLRSKRKSEKTEGKFVFVLSIIIIPPTIAIPLLWMSSADWNKTMVELMLGTFIPVFLLAIISMFLAARLKKRTRKSEKNN